MGCVEEEARGRAGTRDGAAAGETGPGLATQAQLLDAPSLGREPFPALSGWARGSDNHVSSVNVCVWGARGSVRWEGGRRAAPHQSGSSCDRPAPRGPLNQPRRPLGGLHPAASGPDGGPAGFVPFLCPQEWWCSRSSLFGLGNSPGPAVAPVLGSRPPRLGVQRECSWLSYQAVKTERDPLPIFTLFPSSVRSSFGFYTLRTLPAHVSGAGLPVGPQLQEVAGWIGHSSSWGVLRAGRAGASQLRDRRLGDATRARVSETPGRTKQAEDGRRTTRVQDGGSRWC